MSSKKSDLMKESSCRKLPASVYTDFARGRSLYRSLVNTRLSKLALAEPVLDFGSGRLGASSYHNTIPRFEELETWSVDVDSSPRPHVLADGQRGLPFRDQAFASCISISVLEHIYDFASTIRELHRVLRPGGLFYASVPFLFRVHNHPGDYFRYTAQAMTRLLEQAGFDVISVDPLGAGPATASVANLEFALPKLTRGAALRIATSMDRALGSRSGGMYRNEHDYPVAYFVTASRLAGADQTPRLPLHPQPRSPNRAGSGGEEQGSPWQG